MEYRSSDPAEQGFDTDWDELQALRSYVQDVMDITNIHYVPDSLLIYANICEQRALLSSDPFQKAWFKTTAEYLRVVLTIQSKDSRAPRPNIKLEHQFLYFPDVPSAH